MFVLFADPKDSTNLFRGVLLTEGYVCYRTYAIYRRILDIQVMKPFVT